MNRAERRKQAKEENRRPNSKKNFVYMGLQKIPFDKIVHDPNLKECDKEVVELYKRRYEWAEGNLVKNTLSKCIIMKGCEYLDSLCSLRFDITPTDDKVLIRNTMYYVGNCVNLFYGLMLDENVGDITLAEQIKQSRESGETYMNSCVVHSLYPMCGSVDENVVDDFYASFVSKHAEELIPYLMNTRKSDIGRDGRYIFEVLEMILKKTDELLPEAQVDSETYMAKM